MSVILSKATARVKPEFTGLLIAITHCGVGVAHWQFTIAVRFARVNLRVMRAVHRLHGEEVTLARGNFEKLVFKFIPVAASDVEILFGEMGDFYFFVTVFGAEFPNKFIKLVPEHGALGCPKWQT